MKEGFFLNLVESDEDATKEQTTKDYCDDVLDEESYQELKESIEEDNEFHEQLVEHCHDEDLLVGLSIERREEFDTILQNYQENFIVFLALELTREYNGVNSLCSIMTKKYGGKGNSPILLKLDIDDEDLEDALVVAQDRDNIIVVPEGHFDGQNGEAIIQESMPDQPCDNRTIIEECCEGQEEEAFLSPSHD